ncbi:hypothetical protein CsSME_00037334 [Camellia sinensis var. sinensis]
MVEGHDAAQRQGEIAAMTRSFQIFHAVMYIGIIKLNTNGSIKGKSAYGGFGGLLCDGKGAWVSGYYMEDGPNEKCPFKGLVEDAQIIFRGYKCNHFKEFEGLALSFVCLFFFFFLFHLVLYDVIWCNGCSGTFHI